MTLENISSTLVLPADQQGIDQACAFLRAGDAVVFPTETVYGLGADATQEKAVAKIYAIKGRPQFNPLIAHGADISGLQDHVIFNDMAFELAQHFWPGPLTLILPRTPHCKVARLASSGLPSLAVRVPSHPVAQQLLREMGTPIVAPSANISGSISATTPQIAFRQLAGKVPLILAAGRTTIGLESSIIDLTGSVPILRRPGGITLEQIKDVIGDIAYAGHATDNIAPNSPGQLESHYAPGRPVRLDVTAARSDEAYLLFGPELGLIGGAQRLNLSPSGDLVEAASHLFSYLDQLDRPEFSGIAVSPIPHTGLGVAIRDRLQRAAAPRGA